MIMEKSRAWAESSQSSIEGWKKLQSLVNEKVDQLGERGTDQSFYSFWDFDGTIISGDITEGKRDKDLGKIYSGFMEIAVDENHIRGFSGERRVDDFWDHYQSMILEDEEKAYIFLAEVLTDIADTEQTKLKNLCREYFKNYMERHLIEASLELLEYSSRLGIEPVIVSASPQLFLDVVAEFVPVRPHHIFGIDRTKLGNGLKDPIVNYAFGKSLRVQDFLEKKDPEKNHPILALGNSLISDGPMLDYVVDRGGVGGFVFENEFVNFFHA